MFNRYIFESPSETYEEGNKILCTTYLKTNLIYDLAPSERPEYDLTSFTKIFYWDFIWLNGYEDNPPLTRNSDCYKSVTSRGTRFGWRYKDFQDVSSDRYPGYYVAPVSVDMMFEILTINERKIFDIKFMIH